MGPEDFRADYLENGSSDKVGPEGARLDQIRSALSEEQMWMDPPPNLSARISAQVGVARRVNVWFWAAAAVALVLTTVGLANLPSDERGPSVVATISLSGTELAPGAVGSAGLIPTPNGWAIDFDVDGLPPAAPGTYYQAWVNNGVESISVGTFHMRGDTPTPIALWSGVDLEEYRTLNVTIQDKGGGQESSGVLVMTGSAGDFE